MLYIRKTLKDNKMNNKKYDGYYKKIYGITQSKRRKKKMTLEEFLNVALFSMTFFIIIMVIWINQCMVR